jgi:hypothetical protein
VHAAQGARQVVLRDVALRPVRLQAVRGEFALAKGAREKAAAVGVALLLDDKRARKGVSVNFMAGLLWRTF